MKATALLLALLSGLTFAADDLELVFKEDLRFGMVEEEMEYEWLDADRTCVFEVGDNGHIYVVAQRAVAIFEFDTQGKFVRRIARKGEGPGEYQNIVGLYMNQQDRALGIDFLGAGYKMSHYSGTAEFKNSERIPNQIGYPFHLNMEGNRGVFKGIGFADNTMRLNLTICDDQLKPLKVISDHPWSEISREDFGDPNAWVDNLSKQIRYYVEAAQIGAGVLADGRIVVGNGPKGEYEIRATDYETLLKTMKVKVKPVAFPDDNRDQLVDLITSMLFKQMGNSVRGIVTPAVIKKAVDKADLPKAHTPIYEIFPMGGNLFASMVDIHFGKGYVTLRIFDTERGELGTVKLPDPGIFSVFGTRLKFHKGYAYAMVWNEDDENQMVRYKYNLDALK